jgi:hypothetical protein
MAHNSISYYIRSKKNTETKQLHLLAFRLLSNPPAEGYEEEVVGLHLSLHKSVQQHFITQERPSIDTK